jgi:large subunit ribosomal protein L21e
LLDSPFRKTYKGNFSWVLRTVIVRVGYSELNSFLYRIKMARRAKKIRDKGKISLSSYFKKIDDGARVCVVDERGVRVNFPQRLRGMTGKVKGSRGKFKEVEIKDGNKLKTFIIHPVHLRVLA